MTEEEWLNGLNHAGMLQHANEHFTPRKARLLSFQIMHNTSKKCADPRVIDAMLAAERVAEGVDVSSVLHLHSARMKAAIDELRDDYTSEARSFFVSLILICDEVQNWRKPFAVGNWHLGEDEAQSLLPSALSHF